MAIITEEIIPFDTFKNIILECLQKLLGPEREVSTNMVLKNNGVYLEGILVKNTSSGISPTFYFETLYDMYKDGMSLDAILDHILPFYEKDYTCDFFDKDLFQSFDNVKDSLYIKFINTHRNQQLLKTCPYVSFLDMSAVVYLTVTDKAGSVGSITVNNDLLETWKVDFDMVYKYAEVNTHEKLGVTISSIGSFLCELAELEKDGAFGEELPEIESLKESELSNPMYIMTNSRRSLGASSLLFNDFRDFAAAIDSDLYIIPSSIHEMILVPVSDAISLDELTKVLNSVNTTELTSSEFLSDKVYYYSRKTNEISF